MTIHEGNLLDSWIEMMKEPDMSSELVQDALIQSVEVVKDRLESANSPILDQDITKDEYDKYFKELFIKHDVAHLETVIFGDCHDE